MEGENFSNWSTVEDNPLPKAEEDAFDDDDFADFESATITTETQTQTTVPSERSTVNANTSTDWAHLFQRTFLLNVQLTEESVDSSSIPNGQIFPYGSHESQALWDSLQDMDIKSICLLNKWKHSHSFTRILQALKVDGNIVSTTF